MLPTLKPQKVFLIFCLSLFSLFVGTEVQAQCAFGGTNSGVVVTPTALPQPTTNIQAGNYFLMNVVAGGTYTVRTCGLTTWDTQLTVYNSAGGSSIAYNDDACGSLRSQTSFTATFTGQARVILNQWSCTSSSNTSQVEYFGTIPGPELTITDVSENEDNGTMLFTVTHANAAASGAYTVNYQTSDVSTTAGSDYIAIPGGVLNFDGTYGDTDQIIVTILDDFTFEGDETFEIQFTGTSDASVDISTVGTGTIVDDESDPNATRPYEERDERNLQGNFLMKGNTNLLCTANCPGTPVTNNPSVVMGYADIDSDGSTVNSSSSNINIPAGATVEWAGLYWGGLYNSSFGGITNPSGSLNIDQVKLQEPGAGAYTTINADIRNVEGVNTPGWNSFLAHADITSVVQASGSGTYFVADIALATGSNFTGPYGGWTMVVVYSDPTEKTRRINVWDGFNIFRGGTDNFTVTGLLTPSLGAFETHAGYFGMDGEANQTGDFVSINGTAMSNGLNPNNNTLNGTISEFGVDVGGRNPNLGYSWAIDIDVFDATGLVPNSATTADVTLGSSFEGIWGGVFVISNEIAFPAVSSKVFAPAIIYEGEESTVTINIENPTVGVNLTNLTFADNLPTGMVIAPVPNTSTTCGGTIVANPGGTTFSISGLNMVAGSTCTFTFNVLMNTAGEYVNTITSSDVSNDQNIPLSGESSGAITVLPFVDTDNDGVGDHADLDDDNDGITDCDESIDNVSNAFAWSLNTPSGTLDMDYVLDPKITDWAISSAGTMVLNSPIFSTAGSNLHINSMTSANVEEAIANGDFVEVEFNTGSELSSFELNNIRSGWYTPSQGDSYYSSAYYSVGGSDAWSPLASDTFHTDDGSIYAIFDHMDAPSLSLTPNTLYRFRIYVYGQIDDSAQNYSILDDINFAITACRSVNTDGDALPDHLDTDSDGDGCNDADEAYGNPDTDLDNNGMFGSGIPAVNLDGTVVAASYISPEDADNNTVYDFQEAGTAPLITTQPFDTAVCPGCNTTFSVAATDTDTYQWQFFNGSSWIDLTDTGIYSGTASNTLALTEVTTADNGNQYRVIVSNSTYICDVETSDPATLAVRVNTVITNRRITYRVKKN